MAFADALGGLDRDVGDRVGAAEERHGAGGGVAEAVRQQVQEFAELVRAYGAEAGGEVQYRVAGHAAGQPVVQGVGQATAHAGLAVPVAGSDHHIVAAVQLVEQALDVGRIVLAVAVHEYQDVAGGGTGAALDRRAVAHRVRRGQAFDTAALADAAGVVDGAVVDHDDLGVGMGGAQARQQRGQRGRLVLGGQDDAQAIQQMAPPGGEGIIA